MIDVITFFLFFGIWIIIIGICGILCLISDKKIIVNFCFIIAVISILIFLSFLCIESYYSSNLKQELIKRDILDNQKYKNLSEIIEYNKKYTHYAWLNQYFGILISEKYIKKGYLIYDYEDED